MPRICGGLCAQKGGVANSISWRRLGSCRKCNPFVAYFFGRPHYSNISIGFSLSARWKTENLICCLHFWGPHTWFVACDFLWPGLTGLLKPSRVFPFTPIRLWPDSFMGFKWPLVFIYKCFFAPVCACTCV